MESPARRAALDILCLGERRAFRASPFQGGPFGTLSPEDRALCEELVMGTWRWRNVLDAVISPWVRYRPENLEMMVRQALRLGAYQILFTRVPPPVAVSATVDALGEGHRRKGLVNAVLRRVAEHVGHVEVPPIEEIERYIEIRFSHPRWIVRRWVSYFGEEEAIKLASFNQRVAAVSLRVNELRTTRDALLEAMQRSGVEARPGRYFELSVHVSRSGAIGRLPGYDDGLFSVQDEAAMAVSVAVDPQPGESVWDVCAAPGGKTTHLAELMGDRGTVVATDVHEDGLRRIEESATRLGLRSILTMRVDVADPNAIRWVGGPFDRVLVDAPCTGLGVLRRRPDLRWRRREEDVLKMAALQKRILDNVAPLVRPGGVLVYSTCTLTVEENQGVFSSFLQEHPDFSPSDPCLLLPSVLTGNEESLRHGCRTVSMPGTFTFVPHVHGTDGFFIARAQRVSIR